MCFINAYKVIQILLHITNCPRNYIIIRAFMLRDLHLECTALPE